MCQPRVGGAVILESPASFVGGEWTGFEFIEYAGVDRIFYFPAVFTVSHKSTSCCALSNRGSVR